MVRGGRYAQSVIVEQGSAELSLAFAEPGLYAEPTRRNANLSATREAAKVE
jgi:hypothetical protein